MADAILIFVLRDRELTLRLNMILKVTYVVSCRVSIWKQFGIGTHTLKLRPQKTTQLWTAGASSVVLDPQIWFWSWMLERKRNSHIELHLKAAIESDCHLPVPVALQPSCLTSCFREAMPKPLYGSTSLNTQALERQLLGPHWSQCFQ